MAIVWNQERMTTGVDEIDREHQELIRRFNEFHDAMAHGQGRDAASRLLSFIVDYTETHFAHEEKCMAELRCPAAPKAIRRDVVDIKTHLKADGLPGPAHIKTERGSRSSPGFHARCDESGTPNQDYPPIL